VRRLPEKQHQQSRGPTTYLPAAIPHTLFVKTIRSRYFPTAVGRGRPCPAEAHPPACTNVIVAPAVAPPAETARPYRRSFGIPRLRPKDRREPPWLQYRPTSADYGSQRPVESPKRLLTGSVPAFHSSRPCQPSARTR